MGSPKASASTFAAKRLLNSSAMSHEHIKSLSSTTLPIKRQRTCNTFLIAKSKSASGRIYCWILASKPNKRNLFYFDVGLAKQLPMCCQLKPI
jgi:hypothetical protein